MTVALRQACSTPDSVNAVQSLRLPENRSPTRSRAVCRRRRRPDGYQAGNAAKVAPAATMRWSPECVGFASRSQEPSRGHSAISESTVFVEYRRLRERRANRSRVGTKVPSTINTVPWMNRLRGRSANPHELVDDPIGRRRRHPEQTRRPPQREIGPPTRRHRQREAPRPTPPHRISTLTLQPTPKRTIGLLDDPRRTTRFLSLFFNLWWWSGRPLEHERSPCLMILVATQGIMRARASFVYSS